MLGAMALEGERGSFPINGMRALRLTGPRLALVGDAGHFFPPIGAQGLNLGLRDVAELVECLEGARPMPALPPRSTATSSVAPPTSFRER